MVSCGCVDWGLNFLSVKDSRLRTFLIEVGKGVNQQEIGRIITSAGFKLQLKEAVSADGLNINYLYVR